MKWKRDVKRLSLWQRARLSHKVGISIFGHLNYCCEIIFVFSLDMHDKRKFMNLLCSILSSKDVAMKMKKKEPNLLGPLNIPIDRAAKDKRKCMRRKLIIQVSCLKKPLWATLLSLFYYFLCVTLNLLEPKKKTENIQLFHFIVFCHILMQCCVALVSFNRVNSLVCLLFMPDFSRRGDEENVMKIPLFMAQDI